MAILDNNVGPGTDNLPESMRAAEPVRAGKCQGLGACLLRQPRRRRDSAMAQQALTVLYWKVPVRRRDGSRWVSTGSTAPTKRHVSIDGTRTACSKPVPADATVVAVTPAWHEHADCYNCANRVWPERAPGGTCARPAAPISRCGANARMRPAAAWTRSTAPGVLRRRSAPPVTRTGRARTGALNLMS